MNTQQAKGAWNEVVGAVREKYGQITNDDIAAANGNLQALVGTIQRKTGEARDRIEAFVRDIGSNSSEYANRIYDQASQYAANASDELRHQYDRASERLGEGMEYTRQTVQRRPLESVLTAFGIGLAAGVLAALSMSSRRR
jgi:uncharacterized protein YjbJ (UPF0337 family)